MYAGVGAFHNMCIYGSIPRSHKDSWAAVLAAMYSASHVESACIFCLDEVLHIRAVLYNWSTPVMDFLSVVSPE